MTVICVNNDTVKQMVTRRALKWESWLTCVTLLGLSEEREACEEQEKLQGALHHQ